MSKLEIISYLSYFVLLLNSLLNLSFHSIGQLICNVTMVNYSSAVGNTGAK